MFDGLQDLFQVDWQIFMAATETWLRGGNPYGPLGDTAGAGAFAYPPTALPWLALFVPLGALGFYVWTMLQLAGWWRLIRHDRRNQLLLLVWAPLALNLLQGQSTLAVVLVLWAATRSQQRGWLWGLALAWALTKPQVAIIPVLWILWQDRAAPLRWRLLGGILGGTLLLALPATLMNPAIWQQWLVSLGAYRERILQMAAWQGLSAILLAVVAYLWYRSRIGGWQWWLSAGIFPQASFYGVVPLLPMLDPRRNYWTIAGLALAGVLQGPVNSLTLPWILAGQMLAGWMLAHRSQESGVRTADRKRISG